MDPAELLLKAQEADGMANTVQNPLERSRWEDIAKEWRRMAKVAADMHQGKPPTTFLDL